nr:MAG TPA: hypothetical protein [Bacteriophage sp.]
MKNGLITGLLIDDVSLPQNSAIVLSAMQLLSINQDSIFRGEEILSLITEGKQTNEVVNQD